MNAVWLEDFLALIECRSFRSAAERRGASQSAFSRRIQLLEDWVGGTLVDRSTHRLSLTPAGERFHIIAEEVVRLMRQGREEVRAIIQSDREAVRFASTSALSFTFFADWLAEVGMDGTYPASFDMVGGSMSACERLLVEGRVHFLLGYHHERAGSALGARFVSCVVGGDAIIPVIAPSLEKDLQSGDLPSLWYSEESGIGRILTAQFEASGFSIPPEAAFRSHSSSMLATLAKKGKGIAWVPRRLVQDDLSAGRLVEAELPQGEIPVEVRVWRAKARQPPLAERFWKDLSISGAS